MFSFSFFRLGFELKFSFEVSRIFSFFKQLDMRKLCQFYGFVLLHEFYNLTPKLNRFQFYLFYNSKIFIFKEPHLFLISL